jgi:hypothetical protein
MGIVLGVDYQPERQWVFATTKFQGFKIIEVADPYTPTMIGSFEVEDNNPGSMYLVSSNDYVYLAAAGRQPGVFAIDIGDPVHPQVVGEYRQVNRGIDGIAKQGGLLYIAERSLKILDCADPTQLRLRSSIDLQGFVQNVDVSGNLAVAIGSEYVATVDVRNPDNPQLLARITPNGMSQGYAVKIEGDIAFIASGEQGLRVINIADPSRPRQLYVGGWGQAVGITVKDTLVFLSTTRGNGGALQVFDVSNPAEPRGIGGYNQEESYMWSCAVSDTLVFAGAFGEGVKVLQLGENGGLGFLSELGNYDFHDMEFLDRQTLCILTNFTLSTLDFENPLFPRQLTSFRTHSEARRIAAQGDLICVGNTNFMVGDGTLEIIDASDRTHLNSAADIQVESEPVELQFVDDGFLAATQFDLLAFDLSDPENPSELSRVRPRSMKTGMAVAGDFAYLRTHSGITAVYIQELGQMEELGSLDRGNFTALAVKESFVFAAANRDGLHLVDASEPDTLLDRGIVIDSTFTSLTIEGDLLFTSSESGFIQIWKIDDPFHPIELTRCWDEFAQKRLVLNGNTLVGLSETRVSVFEYYYRPDERANDLSVGLRRGWQMVSSPFIPDTAALPVVLQDVWDNMLIIKNGNGQFTVPEMFNGIVTWDPHAGYQVKMDEADSILFTGDELPAWEPIPLREGWNLIPYYPFDTLLAADGFTSLGQNLIIAKDENGRFYLPAQGFSNMSGLHRGTAYQIKVSEADTLIWQAR